MTKPTQQHVHSSVGRPSVIHRRSARPTPNRSVFSIRITLMPSARLPGVCPVPATAGTSYASQTAAVTTETIVTSVWTCPPTSSLITGCTPRYDSAKIGARSLPSWYRNQLFAINARTRTAPMSISRATSRVPGEASGIPCGIAAGSAYPGGTRIGPSGPGTIVGPGVPGGGGGWVGAGPDPAAGRVVVASGPAGGAAGGVASTGSDGPTQPSPSQ